MGEEYNPTLYDANLILGETVVGEEVTRLAIFVAFILSNRSVILEAPMAGGKTYLTDAVLGLYGNDKVCVFDASSDKLIYYRVNDVVNSTHVNVPDITKIPDETMGVLKRWGEGKIAEYRVTAMGRTEPGDRFETHVLPPRPFIISKADENPYRIPDELLSRSTIIATDTTIEQNKKIMKFQADQRKKMSTPQKLEGWKQIILKDHVRTLPPFGDFIYKHPAAQTFVDAIPPIFTDCRRDYPKYIDNCCGIARFYYKNRIIIDENQAKYLLIAPQDMYENHVIYGQVIIDSALRCSGIDKHILVALHENSGGLTKREVQRCLRVKGMNVSIRVIGGDLERLTNIGYTDFELDGKENKYMLTGFFEDFKVNIDWANVVRESLKGVQEECPKFAEQYKQRFCDKPELTHPISGELINLLDIKKSVKTTEIKIGEMQFKVEDLT